MNFCVNCQFYYRPIWHIIVFGRFSHQCRADWKKTINPVTGKPEARTEFCEVYNAHGDCSKYEEKK